MNLKWKKIFPITLAIWPYTLGLVVMFSSYHHFYDALSDGRIILSLVVFASNIIYVCLCREEEAYYHLAFWNMMIKLIHIPFFLIILRAGALFYLISVIFPFLPLYIFFLPSAAAVLVSLIITSSVYGVKALILAGRKQIVSKKYVIINIILQFLFLADAISAIILYEKGRKERQL